MYHLKDKDKDKDKDKADTADYRRSHLAVGNYYDQKLAADPFDAYMAFWEARYISEMLGKQFPAGVGRYLDFACGTGRVTQLIAPLARESVAVDISSTMLTEARAKCPGTEFHLGDITRQDMPIGQFDLASAFRFFGNAQDELRDLAMAAIAVRVRAGGYFLLNNHRNPHALFQWLHRLTGGAVDVDLHLPKMRALLIRHGFEIVRIRPIGAWMYRSRLMNVQRPESAACVWLERAFASAMLAPTAPDMVILARKR